jgi:hypothetical protein
MTWARVWEVLGSIASGQGRTLHADATWESDPGPFHGTLIVDDHNLFHEAEDGTDPEAHRTRRCNCYRAQDTSPPPPAVAHPGPSPLTSATVSVLAPPEGVHLPSPTTAPAGPTLENALAFVSLHAEQEALDRLYTALKDRTKALRTARAASVTIGSTVLIANIAAKYLEGLTGTVVTMTPKRTRTIVTIELDAESTTALRHSGRRDVPDGVERYLFPDGIPATCCIPL